MNNYTLKILIVEDDPSFSVELEMLVEKIGYEVVGVADNAADAIQAIYTKEIDFILMDIDLGGKVTGTDIGERIKDLNIPILYISSFDDETNYQNAQKSKMVGYLVKPLNKFSLRTTINLAVQNLVRNKNIRAAASEELEEEFVLNDFLFFKKKSVFVKIALTDIIFVEADKAYINVYTDSGEVFYARFGISKMENLLPKKKFMRIHRGYLIQLQKVDAIDFTQNQVHIKDKTIPVSRNNRSFLEERIRRIE